MVGGISASTRPSVREGEVRPSGSIDAIVGSEENELSIVLAGELGRLDRSGLTIPGSSPFQQELTMLRGAEDAEPIARPAEQRMTPRRARAALLSGRRVG